MVRKMPAIGKMADSDTPWTISKTRGSKLSGLVPTCAAISPTWVFTASNRPERLDMIAPAKIPLIQSAIALSTFSKGCHPLSGEMIDKGFQQVEQENNVGENFHKDLPFHTKVQRIAASNRPGHPVIFAACRGGADAGITGDAAVCNFFCLCS